MLFSAGGGGLGAVEAIGFSAADVVADDPMEELEINVMLLNVVFSSSQPGRVMFSGILIMGDSTISSCVAFRGGGRAMLLLFPVDWLEIIAGCVAGIVMFAVFVDGVDIGCPGRVALSSAVTVTCSEDEIFAVEEFVCIETDVEFSSWV